MINSAAAPIAISSKRSPRAHGLPTIREAWPPSASSAELILDPEQASLEQVRDYASTKVWLWPSREIYFVCDLHADTDAFLLSLVASGGIERTGQGDRDYRLTEAGQGATFIVGGDCFDKGPGNLRLLDCLKHLIDLGADVSILAGNHDLRTYLGLFHAGRRETELQQCFVQMGKKSIPLFLEIRDAARRAGGLDGRLLEPGEVRRRLFPDSAWYADFPACAAGLAPLRELCPEVAEIQDKTLQIEAACRRAGLSLGELYLIVLRARQMFVEPQGEYAWYFERMTLARQEGSFLFVHAGLDDTVAQVLHHGGVPALNAWYRRLFANDLFGLYHGPVGNVVRTKYREIDPALSARGRADLHAAGVHAIVHGHRSLVHGQRLSLRAGMLQIECDASVDQHTRLQKGLRGAGGAAVIFHPDRRIQAISTDHPRIKSLDANCAFEHPRRRSDQGTLFCWPSAQGPSACTKG
jgi:hypothetical protein